MSESNKQSSNARSHFDAETMVNNLRGIACLVHDAGMSAEDGPHKWSWQGFLCIHDLLEAEIKKLEVAFELGDDD